MQAAVDAGAIARSRALDDSLARAHHLAVAQGHATVSLEHFLFALQDDPDAQAIMLSSGVVRDRLAADVSAYVGRMSEGAGPASSAPQPGSDLLRILQLAAMAARQSQRRSIDGAIVLAAIIGDGNSPSAGMLKAQGLTFDAVIKALTHTANPRTAELPAAAARATLPPPQPEAAAPEAPAARIARVPDAPTADEMLAAARARVKKAEPQTLPIRTVRASPPPATAPSEPAHSPSHEPFAPPPSVSEPVAVPAAAGPPPPPELPAVAAMPPEPPPPPSPTAAPPPPEPSGIGAAVTTPVSPIVVPAHTPPPGETQPSALSSLRRPAAGRVMPPPLPAEPQQQHQQPPPVPPIHVQQMAPPAATPSMPPHPSFPPAHAPPQPLSQPPPMPPPAAMPPAMPPIPPRPPVAQQAPPALAVPPPPPVAPPPPAHLQQAPPLQQAPAVPPHALGPSVALDVVAAASGLPARMRLGVPMLVEVRIPRDQIDIPRRRGPHALGVEAAVYRVVSVRLGTGGVSGLAIEPRTPETIWIGMGRDFDAHEFTWQFVVTPVRAGRFAVTLSVSGRTVSPYGVTGDDVPQSETFAVIVKRAAGGRMKSLGTGLALMAIGAATALVAGAPIVAGTKALIAALLK